MRTTARVAVALFRRGRVPDSGPGGCQLRTVDHLSQAGLQHVAHRHRTGEDTRTYDTVRINSQNVTGTLTAQLLQRHLHIRIGPTSTANMIDLDILDSQVGQEPTSSSIR